MRFALMTGIACLILGLTSQSASAARETGGNLGSSTDSNFGAAEGSCKLIGNIFYKVSFGGDHNKVIPYEKAMSSPNCPNLRNYDQVKQAYKELYDKIGFTKTQVAGLDVWDAIGIINKLGKNNCKCGSGGAEVVCLEKFDTGESKTHYLDIRCQ